MMKKLVLIPVVCISILLAAAAIVRAVTTPCGTEGMGASKGQSCPGGKMTLTNIYCLGVTWSPCKIGWLNKVTFDTSVATSVQVGCRESAVPAGECDSIHINSCRVQLDGAGGFLDIYNQDQFFNISAGAHDLVFWSKANAPLDPKSQDGTTVVWVANDSRKRFFSWMNLKKPAGAPADGTCPDADCP